MNPDTLERQYSAQPGINGNAGPRFLRTLPTPTDLLGVAHGFQDRMVQGLQGGQDILIVSHVVHKVIWERRLQRSGVTEEATPLPGAPHQPHLGPHCAALLWLFLSTPRLL